MQRRLGNASVRVRLVALRRNAELVRSMLWTATVRAAERLLWNLLMTSRWSLTESAMVLAMAAAVAVVVVAAVVVVVVAAVQVVALPTTTR